MSILINLLPDTRQAKLRERRRRQMVGGIGVLVWAVCGGLVALMTIYELGQKAVIAGFSNSINENKTKLEAVSDLTDALTAQQHSASLPDLYAKRVYITKFFDAYTQANPNEVELSSMTVDSQNVMLINGEGNRYASVAKLARTLEASNVKVGAKASESNTPYFKDVTITAVGASSKGVAFTISTTLDSGVTSASAK